MRPCFLDERQRRMDQGWTSLLKDGPQASTRRPPPVLTRRIRERHRRSSVPSRFSGRHRSGPLARCRLGRLTIRAEPYHSLCRSADAVIGRDGQERGRGTGSATGWPLLQRTITIVERKLRDFSPVERATPAARERRAPWISGAGLVIGALALILTAVHQGAGPFATPPPIEQAIADKAKSLYDRAREAFRSEDAAAPARPPPTAEPNLDRRLRGAAAGLGALGIALALAGFARREELRACAGGVVLGTAALPWQTGLAFVVALLFVALAGRWLGRDVRSDARERPW